MKVSIGMKLQTGPWGGGNRFGTALTDALRVAGHRVHHDLAEDDLDIILLAEPDRRLRISAYDHADILRYLLFVHRRALVVHRINNSSEARNDPEKSFNRFRIHANRIADHTVFVSGWAQECYRASGFGERPRSVILNGADGRLWRPASQTTPPPSGPVRIVTHHWSTHLNKGWDLYQRLDALLARPEWSQKVTFTCVGPLPEGVRLVNSRHVPPLAGAPLVEELQKHDLYLTAARFEAGPNHVLEGALCGLPLLYLDGGAMKEYCQGFGLAYTLDNFEERLTRLLEERELFRERLRKYPHTAEAMCHAYLELFEGLLARRKEILAARRWGSSWSWVVKTLLNRHWRG
ncbi:MAG: glycosyltransferase family 4 protein [Magnetococcales bacterium]|nr:glycosyltransferase family 4 protein [Magnetococcales bacterium]